MKKFLSVFLLWSLCAQAETSWNQVYEIARPAIPILRTSGRICSGALISPKEILTAHHCVEHLRPITIQWFEKDKLVGQQAAKVSRWNKKADIAILELDSLASFKPLKLGAPDSLRVGDEHATIGHPFGTKVDFDTNLEKDLIFNFTKGITTKINDDVFLTDMSLSPGNSGGPVLNDKAEVIGVVSAKIVRKAAGNIGRLIHPAKIKELNEMPAQNLSAWNASSEVDLGVKGMFFSLKNRDKNIFDNVFVVDFKYWLKDRILLGLDRSVSSSEDDIEYRGYALGYRWYLETKNFIPFYVGPIYRHISFEKYDDRDYAALYIKALFDIEAGMNIKDSAETYVSFGFNF